MPLWCLQRHSGCDSRDPWVARRTRRSTGGRVMTPFLYERAIDCGSALTFASRKGATFLGGGTNLVDLMRETIAKPYLLVDVSGLAREIEGAGQDGLRIGAGGRN